MSEAASAAPVSEGGVVGALHRVSQVLAWIAGGFTLFLMSIIVVDVVMRRVFSSPIPGALEISEAVLPIAVFLAFAYTEATGGNVRVTMLSERFPERTRLALDVFVYALGLVCFALVTWKTFEYGLQSLDIRETSPGVVPFPLYPTKFAIALGFFFITLEFLVGMASRAARFITWKKEG